MPAAVRSAGSEEAADTQPSNCLSKRFIGVLLLLAVVVLWTGSSFLVKQVLVFHVDNVSFLTTDLTDIYYFQWSRVHNLRSQFPFYAVFACGSCRGLAETPATSLVDVWGGC